MCMGPNMIKAIFGETLGANREPIQRPDPPLGNASEKLQTKDAPLGNDRQRINRPKSKTIWGS